LFAIELLSVLTLLVLVSSSWAGCRIGDWPLGCLLQLIVQPEVENWLLPVFFFFCENCFLFFWSLVWPWLCQGGPDLAFLEA
jgi:hypothetical protein